MSPSRTSLFLALTLSMHHASAHSHPASHTPGAPAGIPSTAFKPAVDCSTLKKYDPQWASHGDNYGLIPDQKSQTPAAKTKASRRAEPVYISGFYQLQEHAGTLYATFGGKMVPGVTPGALVALDADSLSFKRAIPLPFAAHALDISKDGQHAVVTHTHVNAFSLIDLASGTSRCRKADTAVEGKSYRGRYVRMDDDGNFYINYNVFDTRQYPGYIMKYTSAGEHAPGFSLHSVGVGSVIPLQLWQGQLLTGSHQLVSVNPDTGAVTPETSIDDTVNVYNYTPGPGKQLLANTFNVSAQPNLLLIDPATGSRSSLLTGSGSVEIGYSPESGQVFSTNYESRTVTVAALPATSAAFTPGQFLNIAFQDAPSNLHVRHNSKGTDIYLTTKNWESANATRGALLHRVHIAPDVQGISGLSRPGACVVSTFDMTHRTVSDPVPCQLLDTSATWKAEYARAQRKIPELEKNQRDAVQQQKAVDAALKKAISMARKHPGSRSQQAVKEAQQAVKEMQAWQTYLSKELPKARHSLPVFKRMAGQ